MRLELVAPPDNANLWREVLASVATGDTPVKRARPRPVRRVWHDGPDRMLLRQGLALSEQRGVWRVETLSQHAPALPPLVREEVSDRALLATPMPETLSALAVFDGREWTAPVPAGEDTVSLTLLNGIVRGLAGDSPSCRIILDGPAPAVLDLAAQLAAAHRIGVPRFGLAAQAIARTGVLADPDRSCIAASLDGAMTPAEAFQRIIGPLLAGLLADVPAVLEGSPDTEPVHRMRVAVRRMRSAITIFRPVIGCQALDQAQRSLKTLGFKLGPTRDWDVFVTETLPAIMTVMPDNAPLVALRDAAEGKRREAAAALRAFLDAPAFRVIAVGLAWLAATRDWAPPGAEAAPDLVHVARHVLRRRLRRLRAAAEAIETLDIPRLHDLRLRAKRTRYAAEMFADLFPGRHAPRFIRRLSRLQQHLGVLNDGAVAQALLEDISAVSGPHAHASGLVLGFAACAMTGVRSASIEAWMKFRDTDPFWG